MKCSPGTYYPSDQDDEPQMGCRDMYALLSETDPQACHSLLPAALRLFGLMGKRAFGDTPSGQPPREDQEGLVWCRAVLNSVLPSSASDEGMSFLSVPFPFSLSFIITIHRAYMLTSWIAGASPVFSFACRVAAAESLVDLASTSSDASLGEARAWVASLSSTATTEQLLRKLPTALKKALMHS